MEQVFRFGLSVAATSRDTMLISLLRNGRNGDSHLFLDSGLGLSRDLAGAANCIKKILLRCWPGNIVAEVSKIDFQAVTLPAEASQAHLWTGIVRRLALVWPAVIVRRHEYNGKHGAGVPGVLASAFRRFVDRRIKQYLESPVIARLKAIGRDSAMDFHGPTGPKHCPDAVNDLRYRRFTRFGRSDGNEKGEYAEGQTDKKNAGHTSHFTALTMPMCYCRETTLKAKSERTTKFKQPPTFLFTNLRFDPFQFHSVPQGNN